MIGASGIGSYLAGLLEGMAEIGAPIEWTLIGPRVPLPARLRVREWIEFDAPIYGRREFFSYPRPGHVDLFHFPHYNLPLVRAPKKLVTFHDAFHVKYGTLPKRVYQRLFLRKLRYGRAGAIAVSGKSAEDLVQIGGVSPDRIHVVPLGPGRSLPDARRRIDARPLTTSTGRTLAPEWLLAVGIDQPHKNMDFLLSAYAMWRLRRDDTIPLVWVGAAADRIPELLARIPAYAREGIHLEPYQDASRVEELYAGARALVFPSLDEGFGLPPLEAMARGIPVLCSRRRPMTDLLGDGPIWFDPDDSATLWRALDSLIDEEEYVLRHVVRRGLDVACGYSWERTARETFEIYCRTTGRTDLLPAEERNTDEEAPAAFPDALPPLDPPPPKHPAREPDYHDPSGLSDLM